MRHLAHRQQNTFINCSYVAAASPFVRAQYGKNNDSHHCHDGYGGE